MTLPTRQPPNTDAADQSAQRTFRDRIATASTVDELAAVRADLQEFQIQLQERSDQIHLQIVRHRGLPPAERTSRDRLVWLREAEHALRLTKRRKMDAATLFTRIREREKALNVVANPTHPPTERSPLSVGALYQIAKWADSVRALLPADVRRALEVLDQERPGWNKAR